MSRSKRDEEIRKIVRDELEQEEANRRVRCPMCRGTGKTRDPHYGTGRDCGRCGGDGTVPAFLV